MISLVGLCVALVKRVKLSHLKVFGFVSYVHIDFDARIKLDAESRKCFFVGYAN